MERSDSRSEQPTRPAAPWPESPGEEATRREGATIGRFVVIERVGAGGMGVVYRAYDPKLRREVALKLLKVGSTGMPLDTEANARLLREAQAMAQLSHPNVLPVYDAEAYADDVFITMEYVDGETLREWIRRRHGWRTIVSTLCEAGQGLVAAHAVGLVHRDFKPSNVLVGRDGRIRVMDFGLARAIGEIGGQDPASLESSDPSGDSSSSARLGAPLTKAGTVMGTPAYMAPEQDAGRAADASSDQFSFCVALFEALYGTRPFVADDRETLNRRKLTGELAPLPPGRTVPGWLHRAVVRGLSRDPDARWPSMSALLAELSRDRSRNTRRVLLGLGAVGIVALGAAAVHRSNEERSELCRGGAARIGGVWDEAAKTVVHEAFAATQASYAEDTWTRVESALDDYTTAWGAAHLEACTATHVRGRQSDKMLDLRMGCLEQRLEALTALTEIFADADAKVVQRAVLATRALPPIARCAEPEYLRAKVKPPEDPVVAERVEHLRVSLTHARAKLDAGKFDGGLKLAREVLEEAQSIDYLPLRAEAAVVIGYLDDNAGNYDEAESVLTQGYFDAVAASAHTTAQMAATRLVLVLGDRQARYEDAIEWGKHAQAQIELGGDDPDAQGRLDNVLGAIMRKAGNLEQAIERGQRAVATFEQILEPDNPNLAVALMNLGTALRGSQSREGALAHYDRAVTIFRTALGPDHPQLGVALLNYGSLLSTLGENERALPVYRESEGILRRSLGDDHPNVAYCLNNLGNLLGELGRHEEAMEALAGAEAVFTTALGQDHPSTALAASNIGLAYVAQGQLDAAQAPLERALRVAESGPFEATDLADTRFALARALWGTNGDRKRAIALVRQARDAYASAEGRANDELQSAEAWLQEHTGSRKRDTIEP